MSKFKLIGKKLIIENIKKFEELLKDKPELRLVNGELNTISINYKIFNKKTFETDLALEARGICFEEETGNIISRPLHKFHNVGEKLSLEEIDFSNLLAIWNKLDGSMVSLLNRNGEILAKTKSSFLGVESKKVNSFIKENYNYTLFCLELGEDYTPIFEYVSPKNKIVIDYDEEDLVFLHLRHIKSGQYVPYNDEVLVNLLNKYNISHQKPLFFNNQSGNFDIELLKEYINKSELEGVVLQFKNGEMLKYKTLFYQKRTLKSRKEVTKREAAKLFFEGKLDDKKGQLKTYGFNIKPVEDFENELLSNLLSIEKEINYKAKSLNELNEESKIHYINHVLANDELRSLIIREAKKQPYNINEYFLKKRLKNYSLDLIELEKGS